MQKSVMGFTNTPDHRVSGMELLLSWVTIKVQNVESFIIEVFRFLPPVEPTDSLLGSHSASATRGNVLKGTETSREGLLL